MSGGTHGSGLRAETLLSVLTYTLRENPSLQQAGRVLSGRCDLNHDLEPCSGGEACVCAAPCAFARRWPLKYDEAIWPQTGALPLPAPGLGPGMQRRDLLCAATARQQTPCRLRWPLACSVAGLRLVKVRRPLSGGD